MTQSCRDIAVSFRDAYPNENVCDHRYIKDAGEITRGDCMTKRPHKSTEIIAKETATPPIVDGRLLEDIRGLIESAKSRFAQTANAALVALYWNVGKRIKTDILGNERAQYGGEIVSALSGQLTAEYGFSEKNLRRMIQFAEVFPDQQIVVSLTRQLSWTHFVALIPMKEPRRLLEAKLHEAIRTAREQIAVRESAE
jgi:hypothetical protein